MKKIIFTILFVFFIIQTAYSTPSVSGVTGTVEDEGTITVSGSGFSTRADNGGTYMHVAFEDFETGAYSVFSSTSKSAIRSTGQRSNSSYSGAHTGATLTSDNSSDGAYYENMNSNDGYLIVFWLKYYNVEYGSSSQTKLSRFWHGLSGGSDNYPNEMFIHNNGEFARDIELVSGDRQTVSSNNALMDDGEWRRFKLWLKPSSGIGNTDGQRKSYINGELMHSNTTLQTDDDGNNNFNKRIGIIDYINKRSGEFWFDDLYLDYSQAQVEIGENATYANCEVLEVQKLKSWSDTSITLDVRQGAHPNNSTRYLFVIDSTGAVSSGYAVTFGSGSIPPLISDISGGSLDDSETITISGSSFEAVQGDGKVEIVENSNYSGTVVEQTVNSWSDTEISINVVRGSFSKGQIAYLFVTNDSAGRSESSQIEFTAEETPEPPSQQPVIIVANGDINIKANGKAGIEIDDAD